MRDTLTRPLSFWQDHRRALVCFGLVGVVNTLVDWLIYYGLTRGFNLSGLNLVGAKALSFLAATIFSFFANRRFTFGQEAGASWSEFTKFFLAVGSGVVLNAGAVYVLHLRWHWPDLWAVVAATLLTFVWSFSFSRFWVFRLEEKKPL